MGGNNEFFENFERNKYLKKLPSTQRVNSRDYTNGHTTLASPNLKIIILK